MYGRTYIYTDGYKYLYNECFQPMHSLVTVLVSHSPQAVKINLNPPQLPSPRIVMNLGVKLALFPHETTETVNLLFHPVQVLSNTSD
jgi:hypothetical protein